MAHGLKLAEWVGGASTTVLDLMSGNIQLAMGGWETRIGKPGELIWETFELVGKASTNAAYLAALYDLQDFIQGARRYATETNYGKARIIRFQPEGGQEVWSLVVDGELEVPALDHTSVMLGSSGTGFIKLHLARQPWWEIGDDFNKSGQISVIGGTYTPTISPIGDLPGRIVTFDVWGPSANTIDDVWMGIKPTAQGTSSFNPVWEAEDGLNGADAADAVDATAHGGDRVTISFATTATMARRIFMDVQAVLGSNYQHMIGEYLVLGRLKVSSALSGDERIGLQVYQSFHQDGEGILSGELVLTAENANHTNWGLYELGLFRVPVPGYRYSAEYSLGIMEQTSGFQLWAERQVTTASLYVDCFILVPTNGLVKFSDLRLDNNTDHYGRIMNLMLGDKVGFRFYLSSAMYLKDFSASPLLEWPADGGVIVLAAQDHDDSSLTQTCAVSITVAPRYSLFRET